MSRLRKKKKPPLLQWLVLVLVREEKRAYLKAFLKVSYIKDDM